VNQVPSNYIRATAGKHGTEYYDTKTATTVNFPRLGAFEIWLEKKLLFSKLATRRWPYFPDILNAILTKCQEEPLPEPEPGAYEVLPETIAPEDKSFRHAQSGRGPLTPHSKSAKKSARIIAPNTALDITGVINVMRRLSAGPLDNYTSYQRTRPRSCKFAPKLGGWYHSTVEKKNLRCSVDTRCSQSFVSNEVTTPDAKANKPLAGRLVRQVLQATPSYGKRQLPDMLSINHSLDYVQDEELLAKLPKPTTLRQKLKKH
jgi:hypothetical protein